MTSTIPNPSIPRDDVDRQEILRRIKSAGTSQAATARAIGISRQKLRNYMSEENAFPVPVLNRIARCLGCSVDDLLHKISLPVS